MKMPTLRLLALAFLWVPAARGQTYTGTVHLEPRCGPTIDYAHTGPEVLSRASQGVCPAPGEPFPFASTNDTGTSWQIAPGAFEMDLSAASDYTGASGNGGTARAGWSFTFHASDLVFTDVANPGRVDTISASMNFLTGGIVQHPGDSNCSLANPVAFETVNVAANGCQASGANRFDGPGPGGGASMSGCFTGYANDGTLIPVTTSTAGHVLTGLGFVDVTFQCNDAELFCNTGTAASGSVRTLIRWSLPCGGPVFNLPPGITVNSAQLGIVNNRWHGPTCCVADVDDGSGTGTTDGGVDINDLLYFLVQFEAGSVQADLDNGSGTGTPDGGVDINDLLFFLIHFEAGC